MHTLTFPGKGGMQARAPERPVLAHGGVHFVGEALALVVADTAEAAQDAAEARRSRVSRPARGGFAPEEALAPGAPQLHENVPGNLALEVEAGDAAAVEAAVRPGGARHAPQAGGYPRRAESHGAARLYRLL